MAHKKGKALHKKAEKSHNEAIMSHTVVGLFNSGNEAQAAKQELIQKGFTDENIDVSHRAVTTGAQTPTTQIEVTDSVGNFFKSLFGDEKTARNYSNAAGDADAILTVHVNSDEKARAVAAILDRNGAIDIDAAALQQNKQNYAESSLQQNKQNLPAASKTTKPNTANIQDKTVIPIVEEQMQVGKREVESGRVRIRSRIIEKPVEASVRLRKEHVVVNRRPVNREVTNADLANFKEGEIKVTEKSEVPVVSKQARVVEEVVVGKNITERQETVRDTVKRTDVDVKKVDTDTTARRAGKKS